MTLYEPPAEPPRSDLDDGGSVSIALVLLHAFLAGVVTFALGVGAYVVLAGAEPARAVGSVGRFALLAVGLALLWSVGTQLGKVALSAAGGFGVLAILLFLVVSPLLLLPRFSSREKAVPLVLDDGRLCQPALDVVAPAPGHGLRYDPDAPEELGWTPGRGVHLWAYRTSGGSRTALLLVSKVGGEGEESFRGFVTTLERGLGGREGGEELIHRLRWQDGSGTFVRSWDDAAGDARDLVCRASGERPGDRPPLVACVLTVAPDHRALAPTRRGLAFAGCGGGS